MVKKPFIVNAFDLLTAFMVGGKLEIKAPPAWDRVKDFLLENNRWEFCRAYPMLCEIYGEAAT